MATLNDLVEVGALVRHDPDLDPRELHNRVVFVAPDFYVNDLEVLKGAERKRGRNLSPYEQVDQVLYEYVIGRPMAYDLNRKKLEPQAHHVWEFKTQDVRLVGWFVKRANFVIVRGELKDNLTTNSAYAPLVKDTVIFRNNLDLDPPKFTREVRHGKIL